MQGSVYAKQEMRHEDNHREVERILNVFKPNEMKQISEIAPGIHNWGVEGKFAEDSVCRESLSDDMRIAVLVGMLPKELQDIVLQTASITDQAQYEPIRDTYFEQIQTESEHR